MNNQTIDNQYGQGYQDQQPIYDEQQQPQLSGGGTPFYQPMIMPSEKSDLYDKIRPEDVVITLRYLLMGYKLNQATGQYVKDMALEDVSLSYIGASRIASLLFPVSNKSVSISKLTDPEIRMRTKAIVRTAMKDCLYYWEDFGIKSPTTFGYLKEVIISIAFITLKQPEGAGVRTFIQGVTQENRIVQEQPKREGGMLGIFRR